MHAFITLLAMHLLHTIPSMGFLQGLTVLFSLVICFIAVVLYITQRHNSVIPTNWPVLGGIPTIIVNLRRLHERATDVLACTGGTFLLKGPMLAKMDMLFTSSPADIHYILSKNFHNYPKGHKFRQIFDILGDAVSNSDGDLWEFHRKMFTFLLNHPSFHSLFNKMVWSKVEKGLLPVLDNVCRQGVETDLQDIFQRFGFDIICELLVDYDPQSMSLDLPYIPCEKALSGAEEGIFWRHILPPKLWKLQRLLGIGNEKKLSEARRIIDEFIYEKLAKKQKDLNLSNMNYGQDKESFKFSTALIMELKDQGGTFNDPNRFLRDTVLNVIVAGRDTSSSTLSWLFYLLAKNPIAEEEIREELYRQLDNKMGGVQALNLDKLVYLHGGLCEALRLYPPIPFQHKTPVKPDVLPSGHKVDPNDTIILSFYTMGRLESVWGKDCLEFKPERWLETEGGIKHQPSYKFPAFNAGPRTCLGKNMSFTQMKIVAATIILRYHVELVEGHPVLPSASFMLHMMNGLKVRVTKRSEV